MYRPGWTITTHLGCASWPVSMYHPGWTITTHLGCASWPVSIYHPRWTITTHLGWASWPVSMYLNSHFFRSGCLTRLSNLRHAHRSNGREHLREVHTTRFNGRDRSDGCTHTDSTAEIEPMAARTPIQHPRSNRWPHAHRSNGTCMEGTGTCMDGWYGHVCGWMVRARVLMVRARVWMVWARVERTTCSPTECPTRRRRPPLRRAPAPACP